MSWAAVDTWLQRMATWELEPSWSADLERVREGLEAAAATSGTPYRTATVVAARTVASAPVEWVALLLGHETEVVLKHPASDPGPAPRMASLARELGLPLSATADRAAIAGAELVVAMGSDETIDALRATLQPNQRALLFGHRFSAAWVPEDRPEAWRDVVDALIPHDSRGCMSPQVVFTPVPLATAVARLADALDPAAAARPRGTIGAAEGARIRARGALARITGAERTTDAWAVHGLAEEHWHPEALPYAIAVVEVSGHSHACEVLRPWARWLSTVGDDEGHAWFDARVCPVAEMQRPPLDRKHDGIDVLSAVVRPP